MSRLVDIAKTLAEPLFRLYGVEVLYLDNDPVGHSSTFVDSYTMEPFRIEIGCMPSDSESSERSFARDVCSLAISVFHEFRHIEQLDAVLDDGCDLPGVSPSRQAAICESYVSTARNKEYYDRHYRNLPHEIDAERFGTKFGCKWVSERFGADFLRQGLHERMRNLRQDVYPVNLLRASLSPTPGWIDGLLFAKFETSSTKFGTGSYRDLVDRDVEAGVLSPIVRDSVVRRRSRSGLTKDLSFVVGGGLSRSVSPSYDDEYGR